MRAPTIEFMPARPRWGWLSLWVIACVLAAGYGGWSGWQAREVAMVLDRENLALAQEINKLNEDSAPARVSPGGPSAAYLEDAQSVARTAAFPLQQVLKALETAHVPGVKLSSIDIHPDQGTADVALEFTDHQALFAYLELINEGEPTPRWRLKQASTTATAGASSAGQAVIGSVW
jgi:hypothetical protein